MEVHPLPTIIEVKPLTHNADFLITWSWEGLVCGLNIVYWGLTSCVLMTEFTSCGLITATM